MVKNPRPEIDRLTTGPSDTIICCDDDFNVVWETTNATEVGIEGEFRNVNGTLVSSKGFSSGGLDPDDTYPSSGGIDADQRGTYTITIWAEAPGWTGSEAVSESVELEVIRPRPQVTSLQAYAGSSNVTNREVDPGTIVTVQWGARNVDDGELDWDAPSGGTDGSLDYSGAEAASGSARFTLNTVGEWTFEYTGTSDDHPGQEPNRDITVTVVEEVIPPPEVDPPDIMSFVCSVDSSGNGRVDVTWTPSSNPSGTTLREFPFRWTYGVAGLEEDQVTDEGNYPATTRTQSFRGARDGDTVTLELWQSVDWPAGNLIVTSAQRATRQCFLTSGPTDTPLPTDTPSPTATATNTLQPGVPTNTRTNTPSPTVTDTPRPQDTPTNTPQSTTDLTEEYPAPGPIDLDCTGKRVRASWRLYPSPHDPEQIDGQDYYEIDSAGSLYTFVATYPTGEQIILNRRQTGSSVDLRNLNLPVGTEVTLVVWARYLRYYYSWMTRMTDGTRLTGGVSGPATRGGWCAP